MKKYVFEVMLEKTDHVTIEAETMKKLKIY